MKFKLIIDKTKEEEIVITAHKASHLTEEIEKLVSRHCGTDSLLGYKDGMPKNLFYEEIECITIYDRKVVAIDGEGVQYRLGERLRDLEEILPTYFIRINKSTIANERCIVRFDTAITGGVDAVFLSGYRDYVSRRCFADIKRRYK